MRQTESNALKILLGVPAGFLAYAAATLLLRHETAGMLLGITKKGMKNHKT